MKKFADGHVLFYEPHEIPDKRLFGYKLQFMAGLGLALSVAQGGSLETLVFGLPRTGKTVLPYALAHELNNKYGKPFSLTMIDCDECAGTEYEKDLFKALDLAGKRLPAIIGFDEFEGCAPPIAKIPPGTPAAIQSRRIRRYASERQIREKTLVLCISNYPAIIELSTAGNFDSVIYFNSTDLQAITEIIKKYIGVDNAESVAELLIERRQSLGWATLGFNVIKACERLEKKKDKLKNESTETLAERLDMESGPGVTLRQVSEYEDSYREWVTFAESQQGWYEQQAKEIISEHKRDRSNPVTVNQ